MGRTRALALAVLGLMVLGGLAQGLWPSAEPLLGPAPAGGEEGEGEARTLGKTANSGKLDLNAATEAELARLPGVGPSLARRLVEAREARGGFRSWDEVDGVPGVGAARLKTLQQVSTLGQEAGP